MSTTSSHKIPITQINQELDKAVNAADPMRAAGLTKLQRIRSVKAKSLEREKKRLTEELGADAPCVMEISTKMEANNYLVRNLRFEAARAATKAPDVNGSAWVFHGRVYTADLKPASGLTIGLYDDKGAWIEQLGYACTDDTGHFSLRYETKDVRDERDSSSGIDAMAISSRKTFVQVSDKSGQPIHREKEVVALALGKAEYREIVLTGDIGSTCMPLKSAASKRKKTE